MTGMTGLSQFTEMPPMQKTLINGAIAQNQFMNYQERPNVVPSLDMQKVSEQMAMMQSMASGTTPGA